jgi:hypothetical protein
MDERLAGKQLNRVALDTVLRKSRLSIITPWVEFKDTTTEALRR